MKLKYIFYVKSLLYFLVVFPVVLIELRAGPGISQVHQPPQLRLASFDIDVTPPTGSNYLAYDPQVNTWDLGLRAKGIVLTGDGKPIVLCAIDWLAIGNEGMDAFKGVLASAAGTVTERVSVNVLHQHDAPRCDFGAEQILLKAGISPSLYHPTNFDGTFARDVLHKLKKAVQHALDKSQMITHIGYGEAEVYKVASNRNIYGQDGKVRATRYTATKDAALRAEPEGIIDPMVSLVSFWNHANPVAVLSFYATHPQSYYRTGIPNPDFPGMARFFRQLANPEALHVHFNGAGGNIGAGKYNDGSPENRLILANRLADGMKRAWDSTEKQSLSGHNLEWLVEKVTLPPAKYLYEMKKSLEKNDSLLVSNNGIARKMAWLNRVESGEKIDIACLKLNNIRVLFMPGELFVEYQLAAKAERPDLFVTMAAYGDMGPGYIGTTIQYEKGGYEVSERASNVDPSVEAVLMRTIKKLLNK